MWKKALNQRMAPCPIRFGSNCWRSLSIEFFPAPINMHQDVAAFQRTLDEAWSSFREQLVQVGALSVDMR